MSYGDADNSEVFKPMLGSAPPTHNSGERKRLVDSMSDNLSSLSHLRHVLDRMVECVTGQGVAYTEDSGQEIGDKSLLQKSMKMEEIISELQRRVNTVMREVDRQDGP